MKVDITEREWAEAAASIDACRVQLRDCERAFGYTYSPETGHEEDERYTEEREALAYRLRQAHLRMLVLIERTGLPEFLTEYKAGFAVFSDELNVVGHVPQDPDNLFSDPLIHISQTFKALSGMLRARTDDQVYQLSLLERILGETPVILAKQGIRPTSEKEVRQPIFDLLTTVFPDAIREVPVPHLFKSYKADIGIPKLKTLIEFKYALDEAELKSELDGVYADIKGYEGDVRWTRYFAVFYTATPVASQARILEEFSLSRVDLSWTPIIVHGVGSRPLRSPKIAASGKASKRPGS